MPIRKKGDVEIKTSASGAKVKQTGYTFYSYDKNAAALYFQFRGQDGQPTDLGKATVHLVMILNDDNGKKFIPGDDEIEVLSAIRGKAKFVLPEMLLAYQGKVTGYVYMNFDDGSRSDDGQFTFRIKHSMITHVLPELGDKYVRDFEDVKEQVEQAADGAKETISQKVTEVSDTSDSAISKVNQVAKTADQAKSDVQNKADEASYSIDEAVKSTESARDKAVKTMNELDYSDRNLLTGTSNEWETYEWEKFYGWKGVGYPLEELGLEVGDTITLSKILDNTLDDIDLQIWVQIIFKDVNGKILSYMQTSSIESGQRGYVKGTEEIPEGTRNLYVSKVNKDNNQTAKTAAGKETKLQRGTIATSWTPAPEDIARKSEIEQIKQAIINLGGSV